jgi:integrase
VRSPQRGQVATTLAKRILGKASRDFPIDFTLHWLRATYAYRLYQVLGLQVDAGTLTPTKQIEEIQRRLNHTNRETTELYLKLFEITDARIVAQNLYEESIFPQVSK